MADHIDYCNRELTETNLSLGKKDVMLVFPPFISEQSNEFVDSHSLALGYLTSVLDNRGYRVEKIDNGITALVNHIDTFLNIFKQCRPAIVGFSCISDNYLNGLKLAGMCKRIDPSVKIVFGGHHSSVFDIETLGNVEVDFVVRGEGEITLVELADCLLRARGNIEEIHGITYRRGDAAKRNPPRRLITNLDSIPFPDRNGHLYKKMPAGIITGRGCQEECRVFCTGTLFSGSRFRFRSITNVMEELVMLRGIGYSRIEFRDLAFTSDMKRLRTFLHCLLAQGLEFEWSCVACADFMENNEKILDLMFHTGCTRIDIGTCSEGYINLSMDGVLCRP